MTKKKIGVFTGNRAEYGLLYPVLKSLSAEASVDLQLFVSGAHLDNSFGKTVNLIKDAGFDISAEIKINMDHDDLFSTALAISQGVEGCAKAFKQSNPDLLVIYGDRFESFAAAVAATQMGIPVAHIEGGDITEGGALDDSIRHAITKISHIHFATNSQAFNNILQLGEEPWRVHNVGLPSLDGIVEGKFASLTDLNQRWPIDIARPIIVFTQHSIATQFSQVKSQIGDSLEALEHFLNKNVQVIITYPNNDAGGKVIVERIEYFKSKHKENLCVVPSLGAFAYHGLLSLARNERVRIACVGNSSSGIKETAIFGCPTVNIGSRQDGRLRAKNLIDVTYDVDCIIKAIDRCLFDDEFRQFCSKVVNPYGTGGTAKKIVDVLLTAPEYEKLILKKTIFHDRNGI